MRRKLAWVMILSIAALVLGAAPAGIHAAGGPVITKSFASKEINPGDTWKVYLNAVDPTGKMRYLYAVVEQPGGKGYPLSMIRIKPENRSELSGYIILNTSYANHPMDYLTLKLVVTIGDGKGNFSESAVFPLTFQPRAVQERPAPGEFKENHLGPVNIRLDPGADGGSSSFGL